MGVPGLPDIGLLGSGLKHASPANVSAAYNLHVSLIWLLLGLTLIHVLAALFHHFIVKDATLVKMLPGPISRTRFDKTNQADALGNQTDRL